ncbi:Nnf1-domain-containing protein [Ascodesmis nigricans]|uniref:Nnf1-domain-containing protein n=1 Tax=Ascodesmis nigricans TaxID=341454 RepID=A0A4V3SJJ3_9PEZI|nr:Nnf1-domain-containing protein [Ascodesmis nigricans]
MSQPPPTTQPPPPPNSSSNPTAPDTSVRLKRAQALEKVFDTAIRTTINKLKYDNFAQCFPITASGAPETLRAVHEQMITAWGNQSRGEFAKIMEERNVIPKLNELDILLEEAQERKASASQGAEAVAASTLPPIAVVTAHIAPRMREANEKLTWQLAMMGKQNEGLMDEIEAQEAEMKKLLDQLVAAGENMEKVVQEVNGAAKDLEQEMEEMGT